MFLHGFLGSGDTWTNHAMRLSSNGYCDEHIVAFDWNTLDQAESAGADRVVELDARINQVLSLTGASQVDLVGHSAGGGLSYSYLEDADRAAKVAHYVHGLDDGPFKFLIVQGVGVYDNIAVGVGRKGQPD